MQKAVFFTTRLIYLLFFTYQSLTIVSYAAFRPHADIDKILKTFEKILIAFYPMYSKCCIFQPIPGHRSSEAPSPFRSTKEGDIHFVEDPDVNFATIAFNGYIPKTLGETTLKGN